MGVRRVGQAVARGGGGDTEGVTAAPSSASLRKPLQRLIPSSPAAQPQDQGYYPTIPAGNENPYNDKNEWKFYLSYYSLTNYCSFIDATIKGICMFYCCVPFQETMPSQKATQHDLV